jgi:BCD family chlorophyll transporter-like MFS transporter
MSRREPLALRWSRVATTWLPFADAASDDLPLGRLLRLSLFQVSVGLTLVLLNGTLNRVMIVELGVPAWLVATLISLPLLVAPFRALIGHRSDEHRSLLGWRRVPYLGLGTLLQFGGLAIMPFGLLLISRPDTEVLGTAGAMLAFLIAGAGLHITQTAGLALATDLAPVEDRPRVVALLYVMLLAGMVGAAAALGGLLQDFTPTRLVQVVQSAAIVTFVLNLVALWKQEARQPALTRHDRPSRPFAEEWASVIGEQRAMRLLVAVGLGAAAFAMQDALLEPYGAQVLGLSVAGTTSLTGLWALGSLLGFGVAAHWLATGWDAHRVAGIGGVAGLVAFLLVIFAAPFEAARLLYCGAAMIGFGAGLFLVGSMTAAMALARGGKAGMALGAWGAVQATGAGFAIALGGIARDLVGGAATDGALGVTLTGVSTGYVAVYLIEIILLLLTLVILGPLVRVGGASLAAPRSRFGLGQFPS